MQPPKIRKDNLGRERRFVSGTPEYRAVADSVGAFVGHPILYERDTEIYDWWMGDTFTERIATGAASRSIGADDIRFLFNHDANYVLARRRGDERDTLTLSEDWQGVLAEASMPDTSFARDIATSMKRGDISGMSFAFEVLNEEWSNRPDGHWIRTITDLRLYDVSVVTYPAYEETDASLRSISGLSPKEAASELRRRADMIEGIGAEPVVAQNAMATDEATYNRAMAAHLGMPTT